MHLCCFSSWLTQCFLLLAEQMLYLKMEQSGATGQTVSGPLSDLWVAAHLKMFFILRRKIFCPTQPLSAKFSMSLWWTQAPHLLTSSQGSALLIRKTKPAAKQSQGSSLCWTQKNGMRFRNGRDSGFHFYPHSALRFKGATMEKLDTHKSTGYTQSTREGWIILQYPCG